MKIYTSLFLVLIFGSLANTSFGQSGSVEKSPEEWADARTNLMKENLDLSETQLQKLQKANVDFAQKKHAIRNDATIERSEIKGKLDQLKEEYEQTIKNHLTEIQYEQWVVVRREQLRERFKQNKASEKAKG